MASSMSSASTGSTDSIALVEERNNNSNLTEGKNTKDLNSNYVVDDILSNIKYRKASPTDILKCVDIVKSATISFHPLVAGTSNKNALQYRQHHAAPYFRCAVYNQPSKHHNDSLHSGEEVGELGEHHRHHHDDGDDDEDLIIGFVTGIRLTRIESDDDLVNIRPHDPAGTILAIRSVVIGVEYRDSGLAVSMIKNYVEKMIQWNESSLDHPISKIVLLCHEEFLTFYIDCGFSVLRPSTIQDTKQEQEDGLSQQQQIKCYYLEKQLMLSPTEIYENRSRGLDQTDYDCFIVDSFAAVPGSGNPAGVVLLPADFDPKAKSKWMQTVAAEFNLAETAFCWPKGRRRRSDSSMSQGDESTSSSSSRKGSHWHIRYYTPIVEMPLCGHATLASAAVLYQTLSPDLLPPTSAIVFYASEDILTMRLADEDSPSPRISKLLMDFPPKPPTELSTRDEKATVRNMLSSAFSIDLEPLFVGLSDMGDLLVELKPEAFDIIGYESLNYKAFFEWDGYYRGVVICCVAPYENGCEANESASNDINGEDGIRVDFLSRFFAPKAGIDEDPVTGSAHCTLGPYFSKKLGKEKVVGRQMSVRSGIVECLVTPDKVTLSGTAITTVNGKISM